MALKLNRRKFFGTTLLSATAVASLQKSRVEAAPSPQQTANPQIIDTNVNLGTWPFRHLKYGEATALADKLKKHRVKQAWTGSFDALFHKNIDSVNARLYEDCKKVANNFLLPFGTVNLAWPDWKEDLRRCDEVYKMKGIRIFPSYQTFDLTDEAFPELVAEVAKRGMILQIVGDMDDARNHHPIIDVRNVNMNPLVDILKKQTSAKVQLLYWNHKVSAKLQDTLVKETKVLFDTARIETNGGVEKMINGNPLGIKTVPVSADRIVFGSHAPYFPVEANLLKLFESNLSLEQMRAIMEGNATKLLTQR